MAKTTLSGKAARVLELLGGIATVRRARRALRAHGFKDEDFEEGWRLLRAATGSRFLGSAGAGDADPALIAELDAWENKWFPIAQASLGRHFPQVEAFVFNELSQAEGAAVILTVGVFLERLAALDKQTDETAGLADRKAARALLVQRGINKAVVTQAESLLEQLGTLADDEEDDDEVAAQEAEARAAAEAEMWGWYREWSKVVQSSITDRRVLRRLGFLKVVRSAPAVDSELVTDADEEDTEDLIIDDTDEPTAAGGVPTTTVTAPRAAPSAPKKVAAKKKASAKRKARRR